MKQVTLLSVDLAKDVFQLAGFAKGLVEVFNRQIKRKDLAAFMARHPPLSTVRLVTVHNLTMPESLRYGWA